MDLISHFPDAICGCNFADEVIPWDTPYFSYRLEEETDSNMLEVAVQVLASFAARTRLTRVREPFIQNLAAEADMVWRMPQNLNWLQAATRESIGWGILGIALWGEERKLGLK